MPRRSRSCSTSTGASRFSDPQGAPWTIAYNPNYQSEARIYAKYILANHPNARIGILYQNDDMGRDYITGLKSGLGDKAASDDRRRSVLRDRPIRPSTPRWSS